LISNITEWRKDIPAPVSAQDFPFSSEFQDMQTSDFFELKDTASECSMDSAYSSQSGASQPRARKTNGQPQDTRPRMNNQFVGGETYSPSLHSDTFNTFADQTLDFSQLQQSATTGTWEATEGSVVYANHSAGQDYSHYANTSVPRFTPSTTVNLTSQWGTSDAQFQTSPFTFTSFPTVQTSHDMFGNTATSQRQWNGPTFESAERPTAVRSSSSYTIQEDSRRASAHDATFGAFVATPTSTTSIHFPQGGDYDQSRLIDSRYGVCQCLFSYD
jgi:hypothetical protein